MNENLNLKIKEEKNAKKENKIIRKVAILWTNFKTECINKQAFGGICSEKW